MPTIVNNSNPCPQQRHFFREIAVDAGSGSIAGMVCFPFEGLKKRYQRGELARSDLSNWSNGRLKAALHPRELFRGVTSFAGAVALNAATGMTFSKIVRSLPGYDDTSEFHKLTSAVTGGIFGAIVASTPVENTIVVQQELKLNPVQAWKYMLKQGMTRPWVGTRELMIRESGFIGSIIYFGPRVREVILEKTNNKTLAVVGAVGVGATFATLTHPFDTLATWRQKKEGKLTLIGGVKDLYSIDGHKAFFRGVGARIWLFTGCFLILESLPGYVNQKIDGKSNKS